MPERFFKMLPTGGIFDRLTDAFAILAVMTGINPEIYYWISETSTLAAMLMPILGCVWLAVQIYARAVRGK